MTRRLCLFRFIGGFALTALRSSAATLVPLTEETFRTMVASHRGRVLLVDFWATWCSPCREELPKLIAMLSTYRQKGLSFATISCDEPEQETEAAEFLQQQHAPAPNYIRRANNDDQFINAVDPKWSGALPALFLFDRNGHQALSFIGETDMKQLERAIKSLL